MTHKIVTVKPDYHYYGTEVPFDKSLMQIQSLLIKHKCSRIAPMQDYRGEVPLHTLFFEKDGLPYMIEFPIVYVEKSTGNQYSPKKKELRMNISGRVIHDRVKALLIECEFGLWDFQQAMMQYLMIKGPDGCTQALQDYIQENRSSIPTGQIFDTSRQLNK
ncbi:MAG: hypothetical protein ABFC24_06285 [Methanoregulaceae archaeon]